MPQQRKKEESERLRGERDRVKFIDLAFERWQVVRCHCSLKAFSCEYQTRRCLMYVSH